MLRWAIMFAILALIAGVLGFGGLARDFADIARILALRLPRPVRRVAGHGPGQPAGRLSGRDRADRRQDRARSCRPRRPGSSPVGEAV